MSQNQAERILFVDDEAHVLDGISRQLRRQYEVVTAIGGAAGLHTLTNNGPFAVVVSDMRMPHMNGAEFLKQVLSGWPNTVRMLLTGQTEIDTAIRAVNEGNIFRFLTKPCAPENLQASLNAALLQYRLIVSEKVLLEQTLHGSIKALTDLLALASPTAFGRATRVKTMASAVAAKLNVADRWQIEVAAMLSQIGCITLPPETADRLAKGVVLTAAEEAMVAKLPGLANTLLAAIPRLEGIRDILLSQNEHFHDSNPLGSRILKACIDLDMLECRGQDSAQAIAALQQRAGHYDVKVLETLDSLRKAAAQGQTVLNVKIDEIRCGMILAQDVMTKSEMLLVSRGQEVTEGLLARLKNFATHPGIREPLQIYGNAAQ